MKNIKLIVLCLLPFTLCLFSGCQPTQQAESPPRGIPVVVEGGGEFPSYLVGVWQQDDPQLKREFVITPDGRLTSAVLGMGLVRVSPDQERRVPLVDGGEGFFIPGPWTAHYDPVTRELSIGIEISFFRMEAFGQVVEGVIRDTFTGTISEDAKRWDVHYFALPIYHAFTADGEHRVLKDGGEPDEQYLNFIRIYSPYDD